jgi:hypothetical protein
MLELERSGLLGERDVLPCRTVARLIHLELCWRRAHALLSHQLGGDMTHSTSETSSSALNV